MSGLEGVYETESQYQSTEYVNERVTEQLPPRPAPSPRGLPPSKDYSTIEKKEEKSETGWKKLAIFIEFMALFTGAFTVVNFGFLVNQATQKDPTSSKHVGGEAKSCLTLRSGGTDKTGLYSIRPIENQDSIKAFCDMETDGGGWTLVASIHESYIKRKCYSDDLWSSYVRRDQVSIISGSNWENEMTFGMVQKCTEEDYKNSGYFGINASDVMIWHVPTTFNTDNMKDVASFRYRTTNNFLRSYGSNLKSLFTAYKPLAVINGGLARTSTLFEPLIARASEIKSKVRDWYEYNPGTADKINNANIYNTYGNQVWFEGSWIDYGTLHRYPSLVYAKSTTTSPFTMITVIGNYDRSNSDFEILVDSRRPDSGKMYQESGSVELGDYKIDYRAVQDYDSGYATICGLFFVVSNKQKWKSVEPTNFKATGIVTTTVSRRYRCEISGYPSFVLFGYVLLVTESKPNITYISTEELQNVSAVILDVIAGAPNPFTRFPEKSVTVPVTFDKGSTKEMLATIPPDYRTQVTPGFIQFNAYNYSGYPNALCPGIRADTVYTEYVCVGGLSNSIEPFGTCGDFAGWEGKSTDLILKNQPSGSAHSEKDIGSSLLIFYR